MTGGKVRQEEPVEPKQTVPVPYNTCDQCGVRAWVSVIIGSFTSPEWYYCAHHYRQHEAYLTVNALLITDYRDKILGGDQ